MPLDSCLSWCCTLSHQPNACLLIMLGPVTHYNQLWRPAPQRGGATELLTLSLHDFPDKLDLKLQFPHKGRTRSSRAYCNDCGCDTLFSECGDLAIPLLVFCLYVCPHRGSSRHWFSKERRITSSLHQLSRAAFPLLNSASDHSSSSLNQTKPNSVILFFLLAFLIFFLFLRKYF